MRLHLHIGNHKTGSTAIQSVLDKNSSLLKERNVIYPKTGEVAGAHHGLVAALKASTSESFRMHTNMSGEHKPSFERLLADLTEECKEYEDVILSSEEFFNSATLDSTKCERLLSEFESVNVICYLRNQPDHIESSYKFSIAWEKEAENRSFADYLEFQLNSKYHEYLPTIEYWERFNNTNVRCCSFDEKKAHLIASFFSFIDKSDLTKEIDLTHLSRNSSPSPFETTIIRALKEISSPLSIKELINNLKEEPQNPSNINTLYTYDEFIKVRDKFKASNEKLLEKYGININKHVPDPRTKNFVNINSLGKIKTLKDLVTVLMR